MQYRRIWHSSPNETMVNISVSMLIWDNNYHQKLCMFTSSHTFRFNFLASFFLSLFSLLSECSYQMFSIRYFFYQFALPHHRTSPLQSLFIKSNKVITQRTRNQTNNQYEMQYWNCSGVHSSQLNKYFPKHQYTSNSLKNCMCITVW